VKEFPFETPAIIHEVLGEADNPSIVEKIEHSLQSSLDLTPLIQATIRFAKTGPIQAFYGSLNELILAAYMRGRVEEQKGKP
jgi:hypothetical protein